MCVDTLRRRYYQFSLHRRFHQFATHQLISNLIQHLIFVSLQNDRVLCSAISNIGNFLQKRLIMNANVSSDNTIELIALAFNIHFRNFRAILEVK